MTTTAAARDKELLRNRGGHIPLPAWVSDGQGWPGVGGGCSHTGRQAARGAQLHATTATTTTTFWYRAVSCRVASCLLQARDRSEAEAYFKSHDAKDIGPVLGKPKHHRLEGWRYAHAHELYV